MKLDLANTACVILDSQLRQNTPNTILRILVGFKTCLFTSSDKGVAQKNMNAFVHLIFGRPNNYTKTLYLFTSSKINKKSDLFVRLPDFLYPGYDHPIVDLCSRFHLKWNEKIEIEKKLLQSQAGGRDVFESSFSEIDSFLLLKGAIEQGVSSNKYYKPHNVNKSTIFKQAL